MNEKRRRGVVLSALLFTLYIFVFLLTEFTINVRCGKLLGDASVTVVYSIGIICTSIGYAGFFFSRKLVADEDKRKFLISVLAVVYLCLTLCFMFTAVPVVFIISTLSALLLFGYIGGFTHYITSLFLFGTNCSGKVIGLAVAAATLLQFVVQNLLITDTALVISLALSVFAILYLSMKPVRDWMFENPLPYSAKPTVTVKSFMLPVCVVAVMSMSFGLGDGIVTQLHASGTVNLASYLRLFYTFGVVIAGIIADLRGRRFLPLCTLCMLVLSSATALFISGGDTAANSIYISVMYLFSGFYVMYLTVSFLDLAPMSAHPDLWAGMGRIVRGIFIGITAIISNPLFEAVGQQGIAITGICLSLLVLLLLAVGGGLNLRTIKPMPEKDLMSDFIGKYSLTPREAEVFAILLDSEATNKDIAGALYISTRVLERYITSIYEKTGTETRVGLINLYYGKKAAPDNPNLISVLPSVSECESQEQVPPIITKVQPEQPVMLSPVNELSPEKSALAAERYSLTRREVEMLRFLYLGKTNEQIASELVISENTVKFHVKNLMKKLSVSSRGDIRDMIDKL